jgi:ubiquinone/menaquinone biosynthesis C-methylase UbiE
VLSGGNKGRRIGSKEQIEETVTLKRKTYKWFYDHIHSWYYNLLMHWCFLPFGGETRFREGLIASIHFAPRAKVLELCCGTGGATCSIVRKTGGAGQLVGVDLSRGQLRRAQKRPGLGVVQFIEGNAAQTAFPDHTFDKVVITHALHEMPRRTRQTVLTEAHRVLRDQGTVIVLDLDQPAGRLVRWFIGFWFFYWLPFNFETPTRRDMFNHGLVEEVQEAGFRSVVKASKYQGVFQVVQGVKQGAGTYAQDTTSKGRNTS